MGLKGAGASGPNQSMTVMTAMSTRPGIMFAVAPVDWRR